MPYDSYVLVLRKPNGGELRLKEIDTMQSHECISGEILCAVENRGWKNWQYKGNNKSKWGMGAINLDNEEEIYVTLKSSSQSSIASEESSTGYKHLKGQFFSKRSTPDSQLNTVYKAFKKKNFDKVKEYKQAIQNGDCELPTGLDKKQKEMIKEMGLN